MRLSTVVLAAEATLVEVDDDGIRALHLPDGSPAPPLTQLLAMGVDIDTLLRSDRVLEREDLRWAPPLVPGKICGVAINNRAFDGARISGPDHPAFFLKSPTSLVGHREPVLLEKEYGITHPEPELAVVIGRRASRVSESAALDHVFGYSILNDVTSVRMRNEDHFHFHFDMPDGAGGMRSVEQHTSYAGRYKGADTFGPLGPSVVTRDEVPNPDDLPMRCWLDDELVQSDRTSSYRYGVAEVISFVSRYETLLPGDVISMGTAVAGDGGSARPLSSLDLQRGVAEVAIEIEGLGILRNPIRHRSEQP